MKVLIVDDTPFMRKVLGDILTAEGHMILGEAANGVEAIEMYKKRNPDVISMDVVMPQMDGITAMNHILEEDPSAIVVISSSLNQKKLIQKALKMGAWDYIIKPFTEERVIEVFHSLELLQQQISTEDRVFQIAREDPDTDRRVFLSV